MLAAIGLAITFGVMGVINMAHGELMMLGAYTTYVVQTLLPNHLDWSIPLSIPAAFAVAGLAGIEGQPRASLTLPAPGGFIGTCSPASVAQWIV